jgi:hypothetical protein
MQKRKIIQAHPGFHVLTLTDEVDEHGEPSPVTGDAVIAWVVTIDVDADPDTDKLDGESCFATPITAAWGHEPLSENFIGEGNCRVVLEPNGSVHAGTWGGHWPSESKWIASVHKTREQLRERRAREAEHAESRQAADLPA